VDVRVIAATNRDLRSEVAEGRFRQDLFYRLDVMSLEIPALRQRPDDVPVLAAHFNSMLALRLGLPPLAITPAVAARLSAYAWPGNVRELRNLVERSLILGSFPSEDSTGSPLGGESLPLSLAEVEKRHILAVLERCEGNRRNAAQRLGVSRKTLDRKCAEWGEQAG